MTGFLDCFLHPIHETDPSAFGGAYDNHFEVIGLTNEGQTIALGGYEERGRIKRMRRLYDNALTKARRAGQAAFLRSELLALHDRKGNLTVTRRSATGFHLLAGFVERAWLDLHEESIFHRTLEGTVLFDGLASYGIRNYAKYIWCGCSGCRLRTLGIKADCLAVGSQTAMQERPT